MDEPVKPERDVTALDAEAAVALLEALASSLTPGLRRRLSDLLDGNVTPAVPEARGEWVPCTCSMGAMAELFIRPCWRCNDKKGRWQAAPEREPALSAAR